MRLLLGGHLVPRTRICYRRSLFSQQVFSKLDLDETFHSHQLWVVYICRLHGKGLKHEIRIMSGGFSHRGFLFAGFEMILQAAGLAVRRHEYTAAHVALECAISDKPPIFTPTELSRALLTNDLLTTSAFSAVTV